MGYIIKIYVNLIKKGELNLEDIKNEKQKEEVKAILDAENAE